MDFHGVEEAKDTDVTMKMNVNEKLGFECKVAYPDLSGYEKGAAL